MIPESTRRDCPRCGLSVPIAPFNNATTQHDCHHGKPCSLGYPPCEQCKTDKALPGTRPCAPAAPYAGSQVTFGQPKASEPRSRPAPAPEPTLTAEAKATQGPTGAPQRSLFGEPAPEPEAVPKAPKPNGRPKNAKYAVGSATSKAAAESLDGAVLNDMQLKVLEAVIDSPMGMTCDELELQVGLRHQTASARINELSNAGYIEDSGDKRKTSSGRQATVWKAGRRASE